MALEPDRQTEHVLTKNYMRTLRLPANTIRPPGLESIVAVARLAGPWLALALVGCVAAPPTPPAVTPPVEDTAGIGFDAALAVSPPPAPEAAAGPVAVDTAPRVPARPIAAVRADAPNDYVVRAGDTLWGIAGRFLSEPWHWPQVWRANPAIENPHLIYPGDVIELVDVDGRTRMQVRRGRRLSPQVRREPLVEPVPLLPYAALAPFLAEPRIVAAGELASAPYILRPYMAEQLILGANDQVYLRGVQDTPVGGLYQVIRPGQPLIDPVTEELLGFETAFLGTLMLTEAGDPAIGRITTSRREMAAGDRLVPVAAQARPGAVAPRPAPAPAAGLVISLYEGVSQVGQYGIVVVNLGERDNLEVGHVLKTLENAEVMFDPVAEDFVSLPPRPGGELLVFQTFERVSYALVMTAPSSIYVGDLVRSPLAAGS